MLRSPMLLSVTTLAALACAPAPAASTSAGAPPVAMSASRAGVEAAVRAQADAFTRAVNARDLAAVIALHTPDAVVKYPDTQPMDVTALRDAWSNAFTSPTVAFTDTITHLEVAASGDVAWDYSRWTLRTGSDASGGLSLRTWRMVNGAWKVSSNVAW
ncbi:MAG TPA: nuclear transport factor 2 family protein [Gemmatimonadaceae bacterium]